MTHPNLDLIDQFFAAYGSRDHQGLRNVLAENATWTFPGHHPLSGTKAGEEGRWPSSSPFHFIYLPERL